MSQPICEACTQRFRIPIGLSRMESGSGPSGELTWKMVCPRCNQWRLHVPKKQHTCPHCRRGFEEMIPFRDRYQK
jgi:ssDNA-binding Zn-finger/Zn-ribbon topoisomerase 1